MSGVVLRDSRLPELVDAIDYFRENPDEYIEKWLGIKMWSGMRMVARSVFKSKKTSVRGCHGISKTMVASAIAVAFLNLYEDSVVVTTAPTHRQVRALLWKEIRKTYARCFQVGHNLRGICLMLEVKCSPGSYMIGFSTDLTTNIEGWHAPHILFVIDEAKGIPQEIYDALEGSMIGDAHMLEISTTDGADQQCPLRRHHTTERSEWNAFRFSAFDSPLVDRDKVPERFQKHINRELEKWGRPKHGSEWPAEEVANIPIANNEWINNRIQNWEQQNPYMFETKVLGEFSDKGGNAVIPLSWVERAIEQEVRTEYTNGDVEYGLDVARMGDDQNVLVRRSGNIFQIIDVWGKVDTMETCGKVQRYIQTLPGGSIKIDANGVGAGVFDRLAELLDERTLGVSTVYGVDSARKADDARAFFNKRAEMWWTLRDLFERNFNEGGILSIPDDAELIEDLTGIKYSTKSDGRIIIEPKEEFKKRFGRSPNKGDALVYCAARFVEPVGIEEWAR